MYKIILWVNDDNPINHLLQNHPNVLVIGSGERYLNWSELKVQTDVLSQLAEDVEFIFDSHGINDGDTCAYDLQDHDGALKKFKSIEVIEAILEPFKSGQNLKLHMVSCFAGMVRGELAQTSVIKSNNGDWLNHAIFLHGGDIAIRGYRATAIYKVILDKLDNIKQQNHIRSNLDVLQELLVKTPGDLTYVQMPSTKGNHLLSISSNFIGNNLVAIKQHITQEWAQIKIKIDEFIKENGLTYQLDEVVNFDLFNYLKNSLTQGADNFYGLTFPIQIGLLDGKTVKVDDSKVTVFVDDLYSLVEARDLTKAQFDELIAIQFFYHAINVTCLNNAKITFPEGLGFKISSSFEKLFEKGFDVTEVQYLNAPFLYHLMISNLAPDMIKTILNMPNVKCSNLNNNDLFNLISYSESAEELLALILAKLEHKIDLTMKTTYGNSIYDSLKYTKLFSSHHKLIFEKSLPIDEEYYPHNNPYFIDSSILEPAILGTTTDADV